jgi:hypothetical protein
MFSFEGEEKYKGRTVALVYRSSHIRLRISPDLEQHKGVGTLDFFYYRSATPKAISRNNLIKQGCRPWISTRHESELFYFLEQIPAETTKYIRFSELPVKKAFEKLRSTSEQLSMLRSDGFEPAYAAAFEAFCWEYYGERFFRLFRPENQAERDALRQYLYEYYKANYSADAIKRWEENREHLLPPWEICL